MGILLGSRIKITQIAIFIKRNHDSILSQLLELQQYLYLGNTYIDNLAHKILHTFEKMDAINPTFQKCVVSYELNCLCMYFPNKDIAEALIVKIEYCMARCPHRLAAYGLV